MASVIDQIDLYLKTLSDSKQDSKQEEFLKGLYSIYISPSYLENRTSFDYCGFRINATIFRPIAYKYVQLHPESPEIEEKFYRVKKAEAIKFLHSNVTEYERQFNRFLNGEKLTSSEKANAEKYANQYATSKESRQYRQVKASMKAPVVKNTKAAIAYRKFCECGYTGDFFALCKDLKVSRAKLVILPLQYIETELKGAEKEEAIKKNLHTMRQFIEQLQQVEHDKKVQDAKTLLEGVLATDARDISALCKQLSISREEIEKALDCLKDENHSDIQELLSQVANKYQMENILLSSRIKKVARIVKADAEKGFPNSCYRMLEYALYIGQPTGETLYEAKKILPEEEYRPFSKMLRLYDQYKQFSCLYHVGMVFQEKRFHQEQDGSFTDSVYQLNDDEKQSILDFFKRHDIPFNYTLYSVASKRIKDGSFDPNGDLTLDGKIFPSPTEKVNQKNFD